MTGRLRFTDSDNRVSVLPRYKRKILDTTMRPWRHIAGKAPCVDSLIIKSVYSIVNPQTANNFLRSALMSAAFAFLVDLTMPQSAPASVPIGPVTKIPRSGPRFELEKRIGPMKPAANARPPTSKAGRMMRRERFEVLMLFSFISMHSSFLCRTTK